FFWFIFISFIVFFSSWLPFLLWTRSGPRAATCAPEVNFPHTCLCLLTLFLDNLGFFYHAILVTTLIVMFLNQLIHWIIQQPFYLKIHWRRYRLSTPVFFGFPLKNEAGQRPTEFCQENALKSIYFCFIDYAKAFDCVAHNKLWKILQNMRIPDHLTCLLRNLYADYISFLFLATLISGPVFQKTWLIKPFFNMKPLSKADRERARNQKIPKLSELLEIARKANKLVIFDLNSPPRSHPARSSYIRLVVRVILDSKIEQHLIIWLPGSDRDYVRSKAPGFQHIGRLFTIEQLTKEKITRINVDYKNLFHNGLKEYKAANITINVYLVNEPWLFSLVWCSSIHSVTTDNLEVLKQINHPYYFMVKPLYLPVSVISSIMYILYIFLAFLFLKIARATFHCSEKE
ncbi:hypothetical protein FD755_016964, partial [Muntiacus reevesi]